MKREYPGQHVFLLGSVLTILLLTVLLFPPVSTAQGRTHIVRWGDNLTRIARRYQVTVSDLVTANLLGNPNYIWVGQRLTIPVGNTTPESSVTPTPGEPSAATQSSTGSRGLATMPGDAKREATTEPSPSPTSQAVTPTASPTFESRSPPSPSPSPTDKPTEEVAELTSENAPTRLHLVKSGETLSRIARRYDTTIEAITAANDLRNANLIYPGQRLTITEGAPVLSRAASLSVGDASYAPGHGKWIEVNLSHQTVIAWEGAKPIQRMLASLGLPYTPTPPGRFQILRKYASVPMSGPGYYLPGVPHTMFFYRGYAIHGAYWHNNFGQPMSHGCVNLSLPDAAWLYQWTPLGTPVIIHW